MFRKALTSSLCIGITIITIFGLTACGGEASDDAGNKNATITAAQERAGTTTHAITATETSDLAEILKQSQQTPTPSFGFGDNVSGIGSVETGRDADIVFSVNGTIEQVMVEEGDMVVEDQILAILDVRTFDHQIAKAEAAVTRAHAQRTALDEPPRAADIQVANAGIRQAEANLDYTKQPPKAPNIKAAQAALEAARVNLQARKDQLSQQKTQAELQVKQAVYQLTQAQWEFALQERYWYDADDEDVDPVNPTIRTATGSEGNEISDGQQAGYHARYEQAKASMQKAEEAVNQAVIAAEGARNAEVTGVQAAEQQVAQAQAELERVLMPPDEYLVAQAQAGVDLAVAQRNQLNPAPTNSQITQANATVREAQSALELAKLNREYAELRAPFNGIISEVNIDPGDPAMGARSYDMKIIDVGNIHVDVDISDVDIVKVEIGQRAEVRPDALPGHVYQGRVSYIAPTADVVGNVRTFVVRVQLEHSDGLRPGMSVRVEIITTPDPTPQPTAQPEQPQGQPETQSQPPAPEGQAEGQAIPAVQAEPVSHSAPTQ